MIQAIPKLKTRLAERKTLTTGDDETEKVPLTNAENIATLDVTEPDVVGNIEIDNNEVQSVECDEVSSRIKKKYQYEA